LWQIGFAGFYRRIHYAAAAADTAAAAADTAAIVDTAAGYLQQRICINNVISNTRET
jgi:hypothetical protein